MLYAMVSMWCVFLPKNTQDEGAASKCPHLNRGDESCPRVRAVGVKESSACVDEEHHVTEGSPPPGAGSQASVGGPARWDWTQGPRGRGGGGGGGESGHAADFKLIKTTATTTILVVSFHLHRTLLRTFTVTTASIKMKIAFSLCCVMLTICLSAAFPQKDGAIFSNEAIRQAQNTFLIPKDAQIQKVQEGIEVAAYENIKGDESINLFQILGDQVPPEVVSNLQAQVEQIGKH